MTKVIRDKLTGQVHSFYDEPREDHKERFARPVVPDGKEEVTMDDITEAELLIEMEQDAGGDVGIPYLNDDVNEDTDITKQHPNKPGRIVKDRKIRSYPPKDRSLRGKGKEMKLNDNQPVTWGQLKEILER